MKECDQCDQCAEPAYAVAKHIKREARGDGPIVLCRDCAEYTDSLGLLVVGQTRRLLP